MDGQDQFYKKDWDSEAEKLGEEITEDYVSGVVNVMRLRTTMKDILNMVFDGFGSILGGFMK